jgi:CRP-like cAMP-binding protein
MLKTYLDGIGNFTETDLEIFQKYLTTGQFSKNDLLLGQGQVCESVYFILSGSTYQFRYDDVQEKVIDLHTTHEWCLSYSSFISQKPSQTVIKANADTKALVLTIHAWHQLIALSPVFLQLAKILEGALARTQYFDGSLSPSQKYDHLSRSRPEVLKMFPLKLIASYLNMTPETLSRVRASY